MRCIPLSPLLRFYVQYPVMLPDTVEGERIPNVGITPSPLCFVAQNIGEKQRSDSDEEGDWKDDMPRIV